MCKIEATNIPADSNLPLELAVLFLKQRFRGHDTFLPLAIEWEMMFKFRVWRDPELTRHEACRCPERLPACRCPHCNKRFRPKCRGELFCCLDCFLKTDFDRIAVLILRFKGNIKKLRAYLRKLRYRCTEKGRESREREYKKRDANRILNDSLPVSNDVEIMLPVDFSLNDSIAVFLFGNNSSNPKCQRIGCPNHLAETSVNGVEKHNCSAECREQAKRQRRTVKTKSQCPIAEYIEAVITILYR